MPDNAARYRDAGGNNYRRWLRRLTLWQYALFTGIVNVVTAMAVIGGIWVVWGHAWMPDPLSEVVVLTVVLTVLATWMRRDARQQARDTERHEDDGADDDDARGRDRA